MRFLVDMNPTIRWVQKLAAAGHEVLHWSEVGSPTASDTEICAFAREHEYVVLKNYLDFPQILAHTRQSGPSVVLLRGEPLTPETRRFGAAAGKSQGSPTEYLPINAHLASWLPLVSEP